MRFLPVLAAAVVMVALGPAEPPTSRTQGAVAALSPGDMPQTASGKSSLLSPEPKPQLHAASTPLGTFTSPIVAMAPDNQAAAIPAPGAAPQLLEPLLRSGEQSPDMPPSEVLETQPAQPGGALLSEAAGIPKGSSTWRQLVSVPTDLAASSQLQDQVDPAAAPPDPGSAAGKPKLAPGEKPPRVAEYHWFEGEARDGVTVIGYGHPKRQRGGEFLVGFNCKPGSGKMTFVMFEAGSTRSQFTKGQKVPVTLEVGSTKALLDGQIDENEGVSFPRASASIAADDPLFKVMDDDAKVLRIDVDGWSAAVQLILINDVMPAFSKTCVKKKKPEASAKAPDPTPAKVAPQ
jgi:hypothetical protein